MPYQRKYPVRRQYKRRPQTRGQIYRKAGNQLYKDVAMLKNLINVEFKHFDTTLPSGVVSIGGNTPLILNSVPQGDTDVTRDGDQYRLKSVQTDGYIKWGGVNASDHVRCLWVIDTKPDQAVPAYTDVLAVADINSQRNLDNKSRFIILKDKHFIVSSNNPESRIKFYKKMDMKTQQNTNLGSTFANIMNHALFFLIISNSPTSAPTYEARHRIRFVDN